MRERVIAPADDPIPEALATTGLFLIVSSVIAVAICLASWSAADVVLATTAGIIASLSFTASLVCFAVQSRQS